MGNASENFLLVSNISKDNDIIMGTLYAVLGELLMASFSCNVPEPPTSPTPKCIDVCLSVSQVCSHCWGMELFSLWLTGRSPP